MLCILRKEGSGLWWRRRFSSGRAEGTFICFMPGEALHLASSLKTLRLCLRARERIWSGKLPLLRDRKKGAPSFWSCLHGAPSGVQRAPEGRSSADSDTAPLWGASLPEASSGALDGDGGKQAGKRPERAAEEARARQRDLRGEKGVAHVQAAEPLDGVAFFRYQRSHEHERFQNSFLHVVVALLKGPGSGVFTKSRIIEPRSEQRPRFFIGRIGKAVLHPEGADHERFRIQQDLCPGV